MTIVLVALLKALVLVLVDIFISFIKGAENLLLEVEPEFFF